MQVLAHDLGIKLMVQLHLSTDSALPRKYGKRIKQAGGEFSECRGLNHRRYVTLPVEATALINTLVAEFSVYLPGREVAMLAKEECLEHRNTLRNHVFYYSPKQTKLAPADFFVEGYNRRRAAQPVLAPEPKPQRTREELTGIIERLRAELANFEAELAALPPTQ